MPDAVRYMSSSEGSSLYNLLYKAGVCLPEAATIHHVVIYKHRLVEDEVETWVAIL
jgi:hypothetical protein